MPVRDFLKSLSGTYRNRCPGLTETRTWEVLDATLEPRRACRVYVGLLHLAATHACEALLAEHLEAILAEGDLPDVEIARAAVTLPPSGMPDVTVTQPDVAVYDSLFQHQETPDVQAL